MTKEEFTQVFNMGRSYHNMPYGFNESMKEHWKYKDADEAFASYNVRQHRELLITFLEMNNWLSLEDEENAKGVVNCYLKAINCV